MKIPTNRLELHERLVIEAMKVLMTDSKLNTVVIATRAVKQANAVITHLEMENTND